MEPILRRDSKPRPFQKKIGPLQNEIKEARFSAIVFQQSIKAAPFQTIPILPHAL
jgi:hypothetical protein